MKNPAETIRKLWRRLTDPKYRQFRAEVKRYKKERASGVVSEFAGLGPQSVALDFGGYRGDWAASLAERYDPVVHVFEPHPHFAASIASRFAGNPKIHVHDVALGRSDGSFTLSDDADASSAMKAGSTAIVCKVVGVRHFFADHPLGDIDVAKINIEGGEYDLLPALYDAGILPGIRTLLIQFHDFSEGDGARRAAIRKQLEETHICDWCYDFVWEQWSRKAG